MTTMMKSKDMTKRANNESLKVEQEIQDIYQSDSDIKRKDGFKEMNRAKNSLKAVDRAITDINSVLNDKLKININYCNIKK